MSKRGSHNRRERERSLRPTLPVDHRPTTSERIEVLLVARRERQSDIHKRFLILCEGETEQAYFEGIVNNPLLKNSLSGVEIHVLAPTHDNSRFDPERHLFDNSLQGLIWEAMQRKKKAKQKGESYNEIWIVVDDDDDRKLLFCKYEQDDSTVLFFDDEEFAYGQHRQTREGTPKKTDFDSSWKKYIRLAYSCRAFEVWLLLHFKQSNEPIHRPTEDFVKAVAPFYKKGIGNSAQKSEANAYEILKPKPLKYLDYEREDEARAVLFKIENAIENAVWLRNHQKTSIAANEGRFFGINPFTDVDALIKSLLDKEEEIILANLNEQVEMSSWQVEFRFDALQNQITVLLECGQGERFLINNTNVASICWVQLKSEHLIEKVIPTKLVSDVLHLGDIPNGQAIVQFPPFDFKGKAAALYFKHSGKVLIASIG